MIKYFLKKHEKVGKRLTLKQTLFLQHYLSNGFNGTQAVFSSGYKVNSYNSAKCIAYQNLSLLHLQRVIHLELEEYGLTIPWILNKLHEAINTGLGVNATNADSLVGLNILLHIQFSEAYF